MVRALVMEAPGFEERKAHELEATTNAREFELNAAAPMP